MNSFWVLILLLIGIVACCHPECTCFCNGTTTCITTVRTCTPTNNPPECSVHCSRNYTVGQYECFYSCHTNILPDQCETEHCPAGEIQCSALTCPFLPDNVHCEIQCEAPQFGWKCSTPSSTEQCPKPYCNWTCDSPACESHNGTTSISQNIWVLVCLFAILVHQNKLY